MAPSLSTEAAGWVPSGARPPASCLECGGAMRYVLELGLWIHLRPTSCTTPAPDDDDGAGTPTLFGGAS